MKFSIMNISFWHFFSNNFSFSFLLWVLYLAKVLWWFKFLKFIFPFRSNWHGLQYSGSELIIASCFFFSLYLYKILINKIVILVHTILLLKALALLFLTLKSFINSIFSNQELNHLRALNLNLALKSPEMLLNALLNICFLTMSPTNDLVPGLYVDIKTWVFQHWLYYCRVPQRTKFYLVPLLLL